MKQLALLLSISAGALLTACQKAPLAKAPEPAAPAVPAPGPPAPSPPAVPRTPVSSSAPIEYVVAGHHLRLVEEGKTCVLVDRPDRTATRGPENDRRLLLALEAPCHLMLWHATPPTRAGAPSDGIAVGDVGAPLAWRYPSARGATVLAVIGDAITEERRADPIIQKRLAQGLHCAPSMQGVLLTGRDAALTKKRDHLGFHCVEGGVDEKVLWMLAHD